MGRVKSTALFSFESVKCSCYLFATDARGNCCDDEHEIIKIEDDHAGATVTALTAEFFEIGQVFQVETLELPALNTTSSIEDSPPPQGVIPLFTKHCSLVFYDSMMS